MIQKSDLHTGDVLTLKTEHKQDWLNITVRQSQYKGKSLSHLVKVSYMRRVIWSDKAECFNGLVSLSEIEIVNGIKPL